MWDFVVAFVIAVTAIMLTDAFKLKLQCLGKYIQTVQYQSEIKQKAIWKWGEVS